MTYTLLPDVAVLGSGAKAAVYYYRNGLARVVLPGEKLCPACTGGLGPDPDVLDWRSCRTCAGRGVVPDTVLDLPCAIGRGCNTPGRQGQYLLARWPLVDDARPGGREGDLFTPALCQFHLDATVSALDPNQAYIAEPLALGIPLRVGFAFGRSDSPPILARVRDERLNGGPLVVEARAAAPFLRAVFAHWVERRYPAARIVPQANENPYYASYMIATADAPVWAHGLSSAQRRNVLQSYHEATNTSALAAFAERLSALDLPAPRIVQLLTLLLEAGMETAALGVGVTAFPGATARLLAACTQADHRAECAERSRLAQIALWYLVTMAAGE